MRLISLIIIFMTITYATNTWSLQIKPIKESPDANMHRLNKMNMIRGVMTEVTEKTILIDGKEYVISSDIVVRHQGGEKIKDLKVLRNIDSAIVKAFMEHGMVKELVIEGFELRH